MFIAQPLRRLFSAAVLGGDVKLATIGVFFVPIALIAQHTGDEWANIGPTPAAVGAIAVDPHGSLIIFLGTNAGGVRRSVDGGITWSAVNTGLTNLDVERLAIDASGPQTVSAGTGGGLFKTVDGGATWQNVPGGHRLFCLSGRAEKAIHCDQRPS